MENAALGRMTVAAVVATWLVVFLGVDQAAARPQSLCATRAYDAKRQLCCGGVVRGGGRLSPENAACCGTGAYEIKSQICCNNRNVYPLPARTALVCCGDAAIDPAKQACCGGAVRSTAGYAAGATACCGQQLYDRLRSLCCGTRLYDRSVLPPAPSCCESVAYSNATSVCCGGQVVSIVGRVTPRCCGGSKVYNASVEACCYGRVRSKVGYPCCDVYASPIAIPVCCVNANLNLWCFDPPAETTTRPATVRPPSGP